MYESSSTYVGIPNVILEEAVVSVNAMWHIKSSAEIMI